MNFNKSIFTTEFESKCTLTIGFDFIRVMCNPWEFLWFCMLVRWLSNSGSYCKMLQQTSLDISFHNVFYGKFNIHKDFIIINQILLLGKFYSYRCKLDKKEPSLDVFKVKLKATYKLELYVANKNGVLSKHYAKWDAFISDSLHCITSK